MLFLSRFSLYSSEPFTACLRRDLLGGVAFKEERGVSGDPGEDTTGRLLLWVEVASAIVTPENKQVKKWINL